MNSNGYRLLGYVVWQGGKWYLRRRVPIRKLALSGLLGAGVLGAGAVLAKRLAS
jgi:hypothetical protein